MTLKLREYIVSQLKTLCKNVYYEIAESKAHPYIVYSLSSVKSEVMRNYSLEINIYDIDSDTSALEKLADDVENLFDGITHIDEHQQIYTSVNTRNNIDDGSNIKRRRILINLRYYGKGE
jgi:hypothetical protein